ncbi:MAG: pyridoxal-phosphate dependent enzyme [Candidatus Marinimicrobia bacterium]|nr:pyridoxal-phosphate dependent enzyme [Candidatus Neomarinimicrobiota bacterium]
MNRQKLYSELYQRIGNTSLLPLHNLPIPNNNTIYCKYEFKNPSGSHYDRVYFRLYHYYELEEQRIQPGITPVIENTSGCAGAACAYIGKELGYETHIVAPGNLPQNRFNNILEYTSNLYCTYDADYVLGTQKLLRELLDKDHKNKNKNDPTRLFCLNHSQAVESVLAMEECGKEIVTDLSKTDGGIDIFVSAVGNGTSMLGIGSVLRKIWHTQIIALDPVEAPVVSNLKEGVNKYKVYKEHELYGIGAWGIEFPFINTKYIDETYTVAPNEWEHALRLLIERESLYVGHTAAASLAVALKMAEDVSNKNILIILYDSLDNY